MIDDDDGEDVATNSDIDEVDHQSFHQVDQQADEDKAALGIYHNFDDRSDFHVCLDKAGLGVDHHVDHLGDHLVIKLISTMLLMVLIILLIILLI